MTQEVIAMVRALTHWEAAWTPPSRTVYPKDCSAVLRCFGDDSTKGVSSSKILCGRLRESSAGSHPLFSVFFFFRLCVCVCGIGGLVKGLVVNPNF